MVMAWWLVSALVSALAFGYMFKSRYEGSKLEYARSICARLDWYRYEGNKLGECYLISHNFIKTLLFEILSTFHLS